MNYQKDFQEVFSSESVELTELLKRLNELGIEMPEHLLETAQTLVEKGDGAVTHYVAVLNRYGTSNIDAHVRFVRLQLSLLYAIAHAKPQDFMHTKAQGFNFLGLQTKLPSRMHKWKMPATNPHKLAQNLHAQDRETFNSARKIVMEFLIRLASYRARNLFWVRPNSSDRREDSTREA